MMNRLRGHVAAALMSTLVILWAAPAGAAYGGGDEYTPAAVQAQIDAYLAAVPGATQTSATEVSFGDGVVMSFAPLANNSAGADCPSGSYCVYERTNYGYPRLKLSSCGWQDLAWWAWNDRTESVHYNIGSGSVTFINHGTRPDHSDDRVIFGVSATNRYLSDVYPFRNVADHVYHSC